ncbi:peritrophin-44-like [Wyeomyia smithii]|uniref:peritrophin-44-like n=1 Tax=Wyeomyia smithii TaxID=174621 RepID=UPI00246808F0|nr:peritrophin-44-like [Wyeomyia smithii]
MQKMLTRVFLLVLAVQVCLAQSDEVPGTRQAFASLFLAAADVEFVCTDVSFESGCSSCSVMKQCLGSLGAAETNCTLSASTPYCNGGACSAIPNLDDGCEAKQMECTGEGIFPDPTTCQLYHYCSRSGADSDVYKCPADYVFNADTGKCKRPFSSADCVTIKCPAVTGAGTYGTSKTIFGMCINSGTTISKILVFQCPTGATFDGKKCVYQCTKEGNFADSSNASKYFQCYISGGKYVFESKTCLNGKKFDATRQICVL